MGEQRYRNHCGLLLAVKQGCYFTHHTTFTCNVQKRCRVSVKQSQHCLMRVKHMYETDLRAISQHTLTLYDSGVLKDRIAEMMGISRNDVDDILRHRCVLEG